MSSNSTRLSADVIANFSKKLTKQRTVEQLIESIPESSFQAVATLLTNAIEDRNSRIEMKAKEAQRKAERLESILGSVESEMVHNGLDHTDLLNKLVKRDKLYAFIDEGGKLATWPGKGPTPTPLKRLIEKGASLEDFEVNIGNFT